MAESPKQPAGPIALRVLESKLISTLVTVLVGGLVVQTIINKQQVTSAEREAYFAAYERRLADGSEHIKQSFSHVGAMIGAAENLAEISEPEWNSTNLEPERADRIRSEREQVVDSFNEVIIGWQQEREANALMMGHFLNVGGDDFAQKWRLAQSAVDGFVTCAKACYARTLPVDPGYVECDCDSFKLAAWESVSQFNAEVEASRIYRPPPVRR